MEILLKKRLVGSFIVLFLLSLLTIALVKGTSPEYRYAQQHPTSLSAARIRAAAATPSTPTRSAVTTPTTALATATITTLPATDDDFTLASNDTSDKPTPESSAVVSAPKETTTVPASSTITATSTTAVPSPAQPSLASSTATAVPTQAPTPAPSQVALTPPAPSKPAAPTTGLAGAAPSSPAPATPAATEHGWTVQIGSFSEPKRADSLVARLSREGFITYTQTTTNATGTITRVYVGKMPSRHIATLVREQLNAHYHIAGLVRHLDSSTLQG